MFEDRDKGRDSGEEDPIDVSKRAFLRGSLAGALALIMPRDARGKEDEWKKYQNDVKEATESTAGEYAKDVAIERDVALSRVAAYERLLQTSPVFQNGSLQEVTQVLRLGLPTNTSRSPEDLIGPNVTLPSIDVVPGLYPHFGKAGTSAANPGMRILFNTVQGGTITTNAVRLGKDDILYPASVRTDIEGRPDRNPNVVRWRIGLHEPQSSAGIAVLPVNLHDRDLDAHYAVALQTDESFADDMATEIGEDGRTYLKGYLLRPEDRPALKDLIEYSIETLIPKNRREVARARLKDSLVMVGNVFEWEALARGLQTREKGMGQPVYSRTNESQFEFIGIVHEVLPLNFRNGTSLDGAVAYLVYGPDTLRLLQAENR